MDVVLKLMESENSQLVANLLGETVNKIQKQDFTPSDVASFIIGMINFTGEILLDEKGEEMGAVSIAEQILKDVKTIAEKPNKMESFSGFFMPEMKVDLSQ